MKLSGKKGTEQSKKKSVGKSKRKASEVNKSSGRLALYDTTGNRCKTDI